MKNMLKVVISTFLVIAVVLSLMPTVYATSESYVTVQFDMPDGCEVPISIELYHRENSTQQVHVLTAESDYSHVFVIEPGRFFITASVQGDYWSDYPIVTEPIYEVAEGANLLVELSFSEDVANKLIEENKPVESKPVEQPTESEITKPEEPVTTPTETQPTEQTQPMVQVPSESVEASTETSEPDIKEEPEERSFDWGPFIRAGFFVFAAAVVALAVVIKKKRDHAAYGGDDD